MILALLGLHIHHHFTIENLVSQRTAQLRHTEWRLLEISEREQQRIGHDLHDDIVQDLTAIAMSEEILANEIAEQSPATANELKGFIKLIDETSEKTRRLASGLAPVNLDKLGLAACLRQLAEAIQKQNTIHCRVEIASSLNAGDQNVQLNLYRIVQEAMNNVVKHAQATKMIIRLSERDSQIEIDIEDDGVGFDDDMTVEDRMGLHIMRYRAELIGGRLTIQSRPGTGTKIALRAPV